ncbi:MAG TPA: class I SAM-dependent RNA methyltransferase [Streptosporangiaceae bacterium]|nr:class I SAM-dependent RNA methyltransferase [Streptosporangiaceae bacterium]
MNYQAGQVVQVTATDVAHGGWCVARPEDGPVVFIRHALPGETVMARITEVTSRLARAEAVDIVISSPDRVEPPCPHARPGGCGGCDWQHATLPAQRDLKAAVIRQQLRRLAGLDYEVTVEALPGDQGSGSEEPGDGKPGAGLGWRTRVQYGVSPDGAAGLRAHRSHEVVGIGECPIAHPGLNDLGIPARRWPGAASVEALVAPGSGERAVIVTTRGPVPRDAAPGADAVLRRTGSAGRGLTPVRGRAYLSQLFGGRDWRVSAGAFWQVHPEAAGVLTEAVLAALEPRPGDAALDLYCGAGLFAGALAPLVGPTGNVTGVEADHAAVRDARHNLRPWPWARVHRGDVAAVLGRAQGTPRAAGQGTPRAAGQGTPPGAGGRVLPPARLVVADPPRAGLAREVIDYLGAGGNGASRFAYVSCDPATLARDIALLADRGWALAGLRAFDAFPMTHHVECVATLVTGPQAADPASRGVPA